jgi:hypothetical protein
MLGAQKLRSEAHLRVRRNDEVEAQRRRWTFYKVIMFSTIISPHKPIYKAKGSPDQWKACYRAAFEYAVKKIYQLEI